MLPLYKLEKQRKPLPTNAYISLYFFRAKLPPIPTSVAVDDIEESLDSKTDTTQKENVSRQSTPDR